jgi:hypothetical protein
VIANKVGNSFLLTCIESSQLAVFVLGGVGEAYLPELEDIRVTRGSCAGHIFVKFLLGGSLRERRVSATK